MQTFFKNSWGDFKSSWFQYVTFELIYSLIASMLFVPFLSYLFNRMLHIISDGNLLNNEVFSLALTFRGIIITICISFLAVAFLFIEFGTLIVLAEKSYRNQFIYISEAFLTALRKLPKLLGFGFFPLLFLLLLVIPFFDVSTLPPLFDINVTIFLTDLFYDSWIFRIMYGAIIIGMGYVFVRWILVFQFIFINNMSIWEAMISSWRATKSHQTKVIWTLVTVNFLLFIIGFLVVKIVSEFAMMINSKAIGDFFGEYLLTFSSYGMMLFTLVWIPINILVLTRLFHHIQEKPVDKLKVISNRKMIALEKKITRLISRRKRVLLSAGILLLTAMFIFNYTINDSLTYLKWNVEIASHRGDVENAPENSISSIKNAIDKGVDAVEVDVAMTKDGVIVLNHDEDLQRVAGISRKVKDLTYEEIKDIDIGKYYNEAMSVERIPTLEEVLQVMKEREMKLIIDMKAADANRDYAKKIVELVEAASMEELTYVQSFDNQLLQKIRQGNASIKIGQILFFSAGNLNTLDVDFYTVRESMLTERFVEQARKQNREVWVWTVNIPRNIAEVLNYDIDGIITDYPENAQRVIGIGQHEIE